MLLRFLIAISIAAVTSTAPAQFQDAIETTESGVEVNVLYSQAEVLSGPELRAANHRRDSSCRLMTGTSAGSGTLIAKQTMSNGKTLGVIITCAHLYDPMPWEQLKNANLTAHFLSDNNEARACQPLGVDWNNDLMALAAYVHEDQPVSPLTQDDGPIAGNVYLVGYGSSGKYQCHTGPFRGYTSMSWSGGTNKRVPASNGDRFVSTGKNQIFVSSPYSRPGDSGGGIINQRGETVGVFWGSDNESVYGTYSGTIKRFMQGSLPEAYQWACDPNYRQPRQPQAPQQPQQPQAPQWSTPQQPMQLNPPMNPCPPQQPSPQPPQQPSPQPPTPQPPQQPTPPPQKPTPQPVPNSELCESLKTDHATILQALADLAKRTGKLEEGQQGLLEGQDTLATAILNLPTKDELNAGLTSLSGKVDGNTAKIDQVVGGIEQLKTKLAEGGAPTELKLQVESSRYISPSYVDVSVLWAVQQKTGIDHMVLITDTRADHWAGRMKSEYEAAKKVFPAIVIFDVQTKTGAQIRELPQLVIYSTNPKIAVTIVKGTDNVSKQLQALTRSEAR
jgi:hypothetical protein